MKGRDSVALNEVKTVAEEALSERYEGDQREPSMRNGERSEPWSERSE
jgi:hypothetical protein